MEAKEIEMEKSEMEKVESEVKGTVEPRRAQDRNSGQGLMKYVRDYVPFEHVLLNGGDNGQAYLCFCCQPEQLQPYEKEILKLAIEAEGYENAYFCPDPESHLSDIKREINKEWESITVLNLFR